MVWLAALLSLLFALVALLLLWRVQRTVHATGLLLGANGSRNPDLVPVERMVKRALDASLTPTLSRRTLRNWNLPIANTRIPTKTWQNFFAGLLKMPPLKNKPSLRRLSRR